MTEPTATGHMLVNHITLDAEKPCHHTFLRDREALVYALVGTMRVFANGHLLATIGGRRSVTEPLAHVIRFPMGTDFRVTLMMEGFAADCLLVSCDAVPNMVTKLPYLHWNDTPFHVVGSGTHLRTVGEVPTPAGFHLFCGETLNEPGATSSFPAHASMEDMQLYMEGKTTWEEFFFCICPKPAKAVLYGLYPGGKQVNETVTLNNGDIVQMPLGSHYVQAAPDAWTKYVWFFCGSALQKTYNKWATDLGTYKK